MLNVNNLTHVLKTKYEQVHIACILRSLCSCNRWSRRHYVFELSVGLCVRASVGARVEAFTDPLAVDLWLNLLFSVFQQKNCSGISTF